MAVTSGGSGRVTVWIPGNQLLPEHPAITRAEREVGRDNVRVLLIESAARASRLPYHRRKLVMVLSAMRHYAAELRDRGYAVDYRRGATVVGEVRDHCRAEQTTAILTMAASEFDTRRLQQTTIPETTGLPVEIIPDTTFLTSRYNPVPEKSAGKRVVMENFYRGMRRHFGILMEANGEPTGGKWNFDEENREPLPAGMMVPESGGWEPDETTREVMEEVERLGGGYGEVTGFRWAVTRKQALEVLREFVEVRLARFGPYEDAMTTRSATLFHSLLSPYLNLGLLDPLEVITAAERACREGKAPINSVEGFIRQILGWREYIHWQYWRQMPGLREANSWEAKRPLPGFFWTGETEMHCLRRVISRVLDDGYSHHIERLMVLCNFCLMAGISPREVADWFQSLYIDAFDWVVLPNVIGMGLNADGGVIATKPYIASANYIGRMSDYCGGCRFKPKSRTGSDACPFNLLYWNFLLENESKLRANPRLGPAVLGVGRIAEPERQTIRREARQFLDGLSGS